MILDLVTKYLKRYTMRSRRIVYAHMLEQKVETAVEYGYRSYWNNYIKIGELVHIGASALLDPAEQLCTIVYVPCRYIHPKARKLVLYHDGRTAHVVLCGTPDGFYNGCPVEIKTTRSYRYTKEPPTNWILRARIYALLARKRFSYLVVLDLYTATEAVFQCPRLSWSFLKSILADWLKGINILDKYGSRIRYGVRRLC